MHYLIFFDTVVHSLSLRSSVGLGPSSYSHSFSYWPCEVGDPLYYLIFPLGLILLIFIYYLSFSLTYLSFIVLCLVLFCHYLSLEPFIHCHLPQAILCSFELTIVFYFFPTLSLCSIYNLNIILYTKIENKPMQSYEIYFTLNLFYSTHSCGRSKGFFS